jgi:hypothetical protein
LTGAPPRIEAAVADVCGVVRGAGFFVMLFFFVVTDLN